MELIVGFWVVVASLAIVALFWIVVRRPAVPLPVHQEVQDTPQTCAGCEDVARGLQHIETELQAVKVAVADGIEHVDRVETRIRGTVKRARKELQEHGLEVPGLEAEATTLSLLDGGGGEGTSMPVMPARVAEDQSSVPGVTPEQLRRVRGI